jgi:flavin-dependent dehydrogenase
MSELLKAYIDRLGIMKIEKNDSHGYFIPINPNRKVFSEGRMLITGDAAGFADPITAEGISWAILSGKLAADAIAQNNFELNKTVRAYNNLVREKILVELRYAKAIFRLVYGSEKFRAFLFDKYGEKLCKIMTDVIMGENSYRDNLTSVSNYLKLIKYLYHSKIGKSSV